MSVPLAHSKSLIVFLNKFWPWLSSLNLISRDPWFVILAVLVLRIDELVGARVWFLRYPELTM